MILCRTLIILSICQMVLALPFNDDMVNSQIKIGQSMRGRPANTIVVGTGTTEIPKKDDFETADKLVNKVERNAESILRGKRGFAVNCTVCHGKIGEADYAPMPAGSMMGAVNLTDPMFHAYTDGRIFTTIYNGHIIMPPVGWKLSENESWDIVNYVRSVQEASKGETK